MKKILLTQSKTAIVDDEDFEYLSNNFKWIACKKRDAWYVKAHLHSKYYGEANNKSRHVYMHRILLNAKNNEQVDHINGDGLDNRRENLRICDNAQNHWNVGKQKNNKSGFKGVSFCKLTNSWKVRIHIRNKEKWLGRYKDINEAVKIYNEAVMKYYGEFGRVNIVH